MSAGVIIGLDEAGRGSWAGPLVAAAVALPADCQVFSKDSKQLSRSLRETTREIICKCSLGIGVGWTSEVLIDQNGLTAATRQAMALALGQLRVPKGRVLIDGNYDYLAGIVKTTTVIRGDETVPAIAAASIIAKVFRDRYMRRLALASPHYGFEKHVGYGTAFHREAIKSFGPSLFHRRSFLPLQRVSL